MTTRRLNEKTKAANWSLVIGHWSLEKGFTMVELMVVTAIIAVMSAASIVGFGYLGDILKTKEITGMLGDMVKQEELKILRGDFEKVTIYFLKNYVVIEELEENYNPELLKFSSTECADKKNYKISYMSGVLTQKDGEGEIIDIRQVNPNDECIEFTKSTENEWNYKLNNSDKFSKILRFIHFNVQRENLGNPILISDGEGARVDISAPYGKKIIYNKAGDPLSNITLKVEDENKNSSDTLILQ